MCGFGNTLKNISLFESFETASGLVVALKAVKFKVPVILPFESIKNLNNHLHQTFKLQRKLQSKANIFVS
jgi:hypothetical protein